MTSPLLLLPLLLAPQRARPEWRTRGPAPEAGRPLAIECRGRCPADPPEVGPDCWWIDYDDGAEGAQGRLACLAPGEFFLAGLRGLRVTVRASAAPDALRPPLPLPGARPAAPAAPDHPRAQLPVALLALSSAILTLWWRGGASRRAVRRAADAAARRPGPRQFEALAATLREHARRHPGRAAEPGDLRALDLARFGGAPLAPEILARLRSAA